MGVVAPGFRLVFFGMGRPEPLQRASDSRNLRCIPFAIWFFLAIEAWRFWPENQRSIHRLHAGLMLVLLASALPLPAAGDWTKLPTSTTHRRAMKIVVGRAAAGCMLVGWDFALSRRSTNHLVGSATFALARRLSSGALITIRASKPWLAILAGGVVGIAAIYSDQSFTFGGQRSREHRHHVVFGAILMYNPSMLALQQAARPAQLQSAAASAFPAFALSVRFLHGNDAGASNRLVALVFLLGADLSISSRATSATLN